MKSKVFGLAVAAATVLGASAHAAPFGPATAALSANFSPTITIGATTSTVNLTSPGSCSVAGFPAACDALINGTGSLSAGSGSFAGTSAGTITFSNAPNTIINNPITNLFVFSDGQGGTYNFNLTEADTITFSDSGTSNQFGLYLLGTFGDSNLSLDPTPTSLSLTFNNTNGSAYSISGSLSNPPVPVPAPPSVPEPASIALLGAGLVGLGLIRRKKNASLV